MKIGARIFKTGLAVTIGLLVATLLNLPSNVFAGFAAVFAMQPSIYQSYKITANQLQANFIGIATGIASAYLLGNSPIIVGTSVVIVILLCRFLKFEKSAVSISMIAVISVMETTTMEIYMFGILRFSSLMLGILAAFIVNLVFVPPKYESKLFQHIEKLTSEILQWLRVTIRHLSDDPSLKQEMNRMVVESRRMDELYSLFSEEQILFRKNRPKRARKLVIFRKLIRVTHASFDLLKIIQKVDNRVKMIPQDIRSKLIKETDSVIHRHELVMLSFTGKIKRQNQELKKESTTSNFIDALLHLYQQDKTEYVIFLPLATKLMTYDQELSDLQSLLRSYERFHSDEKFEIAKKRDLE